MIFSFASGKNSFMAAALPARFSCTIKRMRESRFSQSETIAWVLSVQPLATTTISLSATFFSLCESNTSRSRPILASSLWAMIPIEHLMGIGAASSAVRQIQVGLGQESCRKTRYHFAEPLRFPWRCFLVSRLAGVPVICQQGLPRSEPVFKNNQALVIQIGATEVDLLCARRLAFLNEPPYQERHAAEFVESSIGAAILIHDA